MKRVLVCGHPGSGHDLVLEAALSMGLRPAPAEPPPSALEASPAGLDAARVWLSSLPADSAVAWRGTFRSGLVEHWMAADPGVMAVLVYAPPAWAMLDAGLVDPTVAAHLADWVSSHTALLRVAATSGARCMLVNALSALHAPAALAAHLAQALALPLTWPADAPMPDRSTRPVVPAVLVQAGFLPHDEAHGVYAELETMATLDPEPLGLSSKELEAAIAAWRQLDRRASESAAALTRAEADIARLQAAGTDHAIQVEDVRRELDASRAEAETLLAQLHQVQEELEARLLAEQAEQAARVQAQAADAAAAAERDDLARKLAEAAAQAAARESTIADLRARLEAAAAVPAPAEPDTEALRALTAENELLLLQLHQVQEELEHHYLTNKELESSVSVAARDHALLRQTWARNQPADVVVDLRQPIDGSNWYDVEDEGRWTGPETVSNLRLPALAAGGYAVQLDVIGAITPEVLAGVGLSLNGQPVAVDIGAPDFPVLVLGSLEVPPGEASHWVLELRVPQVLPPRSLGLPDDRPLGLRVRSVTFTRLAG